MGSVHGSWIGANDKRIILQIKLNLGCAPCYVIRDHRGFSTFTVTLAMQHSRTIDKKWKIDILIKTDIEHNTEVLEEHIYSPPTKTAMFGVVAT